MNVREALSFSIKRLKEKNIKTANLDALIILKEILKKDDVFIISNGSYLLSEKELRELERLIAIREKLYPISYIKGKKEFYSFEFYVNEDVLIPRPETEMLVEKVLELSKKFARPKILDVGTGSGCIAISVSKLLDNAFVVASDISFNALRIAKKNALNLNAEVEFIQADALSFLKEKMDIVVSNPPYIGIEEFENLQEDVKYEPKEALLCENGTKIIEQLIEQSEGLCSYLVIEIGYNQEAFVQSYKNCIEVKKDLSGLPRMAIFRF